ncbi:MAG: NUDIX domain-containing protein, partial [Flavitalea sp.]
RCKNLIASAKYISTDLAGKFPSEYNEIIKLKGVGPYTTAAIASFAFNLPYAVVDGNVQRVISRYFGINTPVDTTEGKKLYQHLAQALLDPDKPAEYNQAIMDFGAVVCKPQNPVCVNCPQKNDCQANTLGFVSSLPVKEKKLVKKHRWFYYFMINTPDAVYIRKRTEKDIWQNLHEFPMHEAQDPEPFPHKNFLRSLLGVQPYSVVSQSRVYVQQLTHQTIHGQFIQVSIPKTVSVPETFTPIAKKDLARYAFPRMLNTFLEEEFV